MLLKSLNINNCRILGNTSLTLCPHINIFIGKNASGKTSLLEAISILSKGRSFRSSHISDVISHKHNEILVSARIVDEKNTYNIGIKKSPTKTKIRINNQDIYSQAELSAHLPVTIIHPDSINLITGSPSLRRSYLDWLAFYIFPNFYQLWKNYKHILKQRNLCLKNPIHHYALDNWTSELIKLQPDINAYRKKTTELLLPFFRKVIASLFDDADVDIHYKTGFPKEVKIDTSSLLHFYQKKKESDLFLKRTSYGVHRADISLRLNNSSAIDIASRGQLKLLAISLLLAQTSLIAKEINKKGLLLIDDIGAELDAENTNRLLDYVISLNLQTIITSTKPLDIFTDQQKMFHVKHGNIIGVNEPKN